MTSFSSQKTFDSKEKLRDFPTSEGHQVEIPKKKSPTLFSTANIKSDFGGIAKPLAYGPLKSHFTIITDDFAHCVADISALKNLILFVETRKNTIKYAWQWSKKRADQKNKQKEHC